MADFRNDNTLKALAIAGAAAAVGLAGYLAWNACSTKGKKAVDEPDAAPDTPRLKSALKGAGAARQGASVEFKTTVILRDGSGQDSYAATEPVHGLKFSELDAYQRINRQYQAALHTSLNDIQSACIATIAMYEVHGADIGHRIPEDIISLEEGSPELGFLTPEHKAQFITAKHEATRTPAVAEAAAASADITAADCRQELDITALERATAAASEIVMDR